MLPCFTPKELEKMGVYDENSKNYYTSSTVKPDADEQKFLNMYRETGRVPSNYYEMVKERISDMITEHSNPDSMQRMLYVGWNPYIINLNPTDIKEMDEVMEEMLFDEGYTIDDIDLVDITERASGREAITDEDDDDKKDNINTRGETYNPENEYDE